MLDSGMIAECPVCDYETRVWEQDITENAANLLDDEPLVVCHCPECDPRNVGDPIRDRTPQLQIKQTA